MARILIIEDEPHILLLIANIFAKRGYEVVALHNPYATFNTLRDQAPFDLIITDIKMPQMDGFTLIEELRQQNLIIPIIVISADPQLAEKAAQHQIVHYLLKPFDSRFLLEKVEDILREKLP